MTLKLVCEGEYVAKVDVDVTGTDSGWPPYLLLKDAQKLDDVREALLKGKLENHQLACAHVYPQSQLTLWPLPDNSEMNTPV